MVEKMTIQSAIGWTLFITILLFDFIFIGAIHKFNTVQNELSHNIVTASINLFFFIGIPLIFGSVISIFMEKKQIFKTQKKEKYFRKFLLIFCPFLFFARAFLTLFLQKRHYYEYEVNKYKFIEGPDYFILFLLVFFGLICFYLAKLKNN